ncbi:hypothetical protein MTO96_020946 [Rhipicephalus appendiculatus]
MHAAARIDVLPSVGASDRELDVGLPHVQNRDLRQQPLGAVYTFRVKLGRDEAGERRKSAQHKYPDSRTCGAVPIQA